MTLDFNEFRNGWSKLEPNIFKIVLWINRANNDRWNSLINDIMITNSYIINIYHIYALISDNDMVDDALTIDCLWWSHWCQWRWTSNSFFRVWWVSKMKCSIFKFFFLLDYFDLEDVLKHLTQSLEYYWFKSNYDN